MQSYTNATHSLVLETLTPLPKDRKCFRLVNGVLLEKTVGEVVPDLTTQKEGLAKVLETLVKDYKKKEGELEQWKKTNNIQVVQQ
jgi:prefoldin subunit 2